MKMKNVKNRFENEILQNLPASALPCNMSCEWLDYFLMQAEYAVEGQQEALPSELLAVVVSILFEKSNSEKIEIPPSRLFEYFKQYSIELALEKANRAGQYKSTSATLGTIFTNRKIEIVEKLV